MPLHFSTQVSGLFSKVEQARFSPSAGCHAVGHNHKFYCVFRQEAAATTAVYAQMSLPGTWSVARSLYLESPYADPTLFTFKGELYALVAGNTEQAQSVPARLTNINVNTLVTTSEVFTIQFQGTPALVEHRQKLYLFYRQPGTGELRWSWTSDLDTWAASEAVMSGGEVLTPVGDPACCVYQGVIHLFHGTTSDVSHMRFDGDSGWSRSQTFIERKFEHPPVVVVHDGLLNLFCVKPDGRPVDTAIYRYRYDGNAVGLVDLCENMLATDLPGAAVVDGHLILAYRSI